MKKNLCLIVLLLTAANSICQDVLVFKGTVRCFNDDDQRSTRGAKNVVVVPGFIPSKAGMTGPQGYYELNTAIPLTRLEGKYVMIYFVSSCKNCELKKSVFVSDDQVKQTARNLSYLTVETVQMTAGCRLTELRPLASDSIYNAFIRLPSQDLDKISPLNAVTATPGVLNVLTNIISAPVIINFGDFVADTAGLAPGKIGYGNFLFSSPMILTANMGFNFSPNRDLSEAAFWNPSALSTSNSKGGISLFTNLKNNGKLSGFVKINDKFAIGAGGIYTVQDNFRQTRFRNGGNIVTPLHFQKLKEYAAYLSPSYRINTVFSAGVGLKFIGQNFTIPKQLRIESNPDRNIFTDSTVSQQKFDADISFSYQVTRSFKAGINIMNIAGTELFADAFPAGKKIVAKRQLRSYGLGLCYKWKQFNFGTDVLVTEDDLYDVAIGINYIPFNNALLSGGFAFKQQAFSFSFKMKYFRLSYVNDNGLMINEKRKGKSSILNGQLYSGLVFNF